MASPPVALGTARFAVPGESERRSGTQRLRVVLTRVPRIGAGLAIVTGFIALGAWWSGAGGLGRLLPGPTRVTPNTAALMIASGVALLLLHRTPISRLRRRAVIVCASVIIAVSTLTLFEYAAGIELGIDRLLSRAERTRETWPLSRPSPQTLVAFLLLGGVLLALWRGHRRLADYLALIAGAIAIAALLGYLFGVPLMYGDLVPILGMSIPTATVLLAMALGFLALRIDEGILAVIVAPDAGGVAARRMLVGLASFPVLVVVVIAGARAGWYGLPIAAAIVVFLALAESSTFIIATAKRLSAADADTRRAADALAIAEERMRTLVEHASDPFFVADLEGRYTYVNAAAEQLLGYPAGELIGRTIGDVVLESDAVRLADTKQRLLAGAVDTGEWTLRRRDGTLVPVEVSAKIFADGRWQASARDISERKLAEELRARGEAIERKLRGELEAVMAASSAVSDALAQLTTADLEPFLAVIAEQARKLTSARYAVVGVGTDPERPFGHWAQVGIDEAVAREIGHMLGGLNVLHEPLRVADIHAHPAFRGLPPGAPDITSLLAVPVSHHQRLVGSIVLANKREAPGFGELDAHLVAMLAERVASAIETATQYSNEATQRAWLRSIVDQLPEGVILADAEGRVTTINRAMLEMGGVAATRELALAEASLFGVHDAAGQPVAADDLPLYRAARFGEATRDREYQLHRPDHSIVHASVTAVPVRGADERHAGAVLVVNDISERRELERQREEWVAVIAHDLRQPLNTIMVASELLLAVARRRADDAESSPAERIRSAAWRLSRMVEDLLDAARIAANRLAIEPRVTDVVAVARAVIEVARLEHPTASIALHAPDHQVAWTDPDRLHQVLGNLISNALKYGTPGTPIDVEIAREGAAGRVVISNAGPQIPPDELARLFTRFARTRTARQTRAPGIGLGLYICKGLIEAHGGRIWAESTPERTSIHFTLPEPPG